MTQEMVQRLQSMGKKRGVGSQALMFATVNEHFGGTLPLESPKQTLINTFINGPPLAETGKEMKKVKCWPC